MQKKEYRTLDVKERCEDEVADNLSLFGWDLIMKEAKSVELGHDHREMVLYTGDCPFVTRVREDDVFNVHYSSLTFVRNMEGRNYPFFKKWGDVYDNLTQDEAYLGIYCIRHGEKARVNGCLLFLYLLMVIVPAVVLFLAKGKGWIFDITTSGSYGAYGLAFLAFLGIVFMLCGLCYRLYHCHLRRQAKKDLRKIHDIRNDFVKQMKDGDYRPNLNFRKITKIEYRYLNRAHINHEDGLLDKEERWTHSWKRL